MQTNQWCCLCKLAYIQCYKLSDGTSLGDGYDETGGMCQKHDSDRRCLSTGECRRCKYVTTDSAGTTVNRYEGCEGITSTSPICDGDSSTTVVDFAATSYDDEALNPSCVKCKKIGNAIKRKLTKM